MTATQTKSLLFILLTLAFTRLLPHPVNVAPLGAIALFSGAIFRLKWLRYALPVALAILTDIVLVLTINAQYTSLPSYFGSPSTWMMYVVYILIAQLGYFASKSGLAKKPLRIAGISLSGSLIFFLVSNFAVWLGGFYGYSLGGLTACYVAALPFLHHSLIGDLMYNALLFGGLYWANAHVWKENPIQA